MILKKAITFEEVLKKANALSPAIDHFEKPTVWWSANTAWWTDDPNDLQPGSIPLDSLGSPLFQGNLKIFLKGATKQPEKQYGEFALNTFMAMHHKNFSPELGENKKLFSSFLSFEEAIRRKRVIEPDFQLITKD